MVIKIGDRSFGTRSRRYSKGSYFCYSATLCSATLKDSTPVASTLFLAAPLKPVRPTHCDAPGAYLPKATSSVHSSKSSSSPSFESTRPREHMISPGFGGGSTGC